MKTRALKQAWGESIMPLLNSLTRWKPGLSVAMAISLFVLVPMGAQSQVNSEFDRAWQKIRNHYVNGLEEQGVIGSSLWFLHEGDVIAREFYGMADQAQGRRVDENTIFHWASITKTLTGIAIMQLRDRGLLHLDDPVVDYVPELRAVHNPFGKMDQITIRHLMTHSAGFRGSTWPWGGDQPWHPHEPKTWQQVVAMLPYSKIHFKPGSRYSYSNPGIIFLGRIIEYLTDDDYEVYVDKNILRPLGMSRSYFDTTPYHLLKYRSNNYSVEAGVITANGLDFNTGITVSNGGLNAPITDMVKYINFLTGSGDAGMGYEAILQRASLREMFNQEIEVGENEYRGLIFFLKQRKALRLVGHTGSQQAFISFIFFDPESRAACIAAFNTLGLSQAGTPRPDTRAMSTQLQEALFRTLFPLFGR